MSRTQLFVLLSLPIIIGTLAGIAYAPALTLNLLILLKWVLLVMLIFRVLGWFVSPFASSGGTSRRSKPNYIYSERDTDLESGHFEYVDRNTKILHADGYAFEVTNRFNGHLMWREVDPASREGIGSWTQAHPKDAAFHLC